MMARKSAHSSFTMKKVAAAQPSLAMNLVVLLALASGAAAADSPGGLVIVAPERFHQALAPYLVHKAKQMPADLLALEDILKRSTGADDPERLKHGLYDDWKRRRTRYVLLVGDADALPVRYMVLDRVTAHAKDYAFYPSDLYYADLAKPDGSFEDWNGEKDGFHAGYFGEVRGEKNKDGPINFDRIDYLPDIAVGRWPVSTTAEVEVVAAKTIRYEEGVLRAGKTGERRAAFVNVGGWVDCRPFFDGLSRICLRAGAPRKLYYSGRRAGPATPPPSVEEVLRALNGGLGLLVHAGHGADSRWEGSLGLKNLPQIQNQDFLPVVISAGCSTARFATLPPYEPYVDVAGASTRERTTARSSTSRLRRPRRTNRVGSTPPAWARASSAGAPAARWRTSAATPAVSPAACRWSKGSWAAWMAWPSRASATCGPGQSSTTSRRSGWRS